jgi:hypothetical protein
VLVVRGNPRPHLTLSEGEEVVFDCIELYAQFRQSYDAHARPYIHANLQDAQRRVDALVRHDRVKARSLIDALPFEHFPQTLPSGIELTTPLHVRWARDPSRN